MTTKKQAIAGLKADLFAEQIPLPLKTFMYTIDQISVMLDMTEQMLRRKVLFYVGREMQKQDPMKMRAINISGIDEKAEWRVSEEELVRWCRKRKVRFYVSRRILAEVGPGQS